MERPARADSGEGKEREAGREDHATVPLRVKELG